MMKEWKEQSECLKSQMLSWSENMVNKIIKLYLQGLYIWEITKALDMTEAYIVKVLEHNHII